LAGTAFLPWEEWLAWVVHKLAIIIRRSLNRIHRQRSLAYSENWAQAEGTVEGINSDSSNPREEIVYSYSTQRGYYSRSFWYWFDSSDGRHVRVGDRIVLRYDPANHENSVLLQFP